VRCGIPRPADRRGAGRRLFRFRCRNLP
jgi:hypothetical protein